MTELPKGPYTLWVYYGYEGWAFYDHNTFAEALADIGHHMTAEWTIQKPVTIKEQDNAA